MPPAQFDILWDDLRTIPVPALSHNQQRAIADFLDAETARIDALIAKKRRLIALLDERVSAEVDRAVEVALDWSAGGIPHPRHESWPVLPLGRVAAVQTGLTLDASRSTDADVVELPYLRVANVQDGSLDLDEVKIVSVPAGLARRCMLRDGDVLMTEGGDPDKLGRGAVWRSDIDPCLHQNHVFAVRPGTALAPEFLALVTRTSYARSYFEVTAAKTTGIASTSTAKIAAFRIPLPARATQSRIVRSWENSMTLLTTVISRVGQQVALLQERRRALITAAVTGDLDIPGVAA